MFYEYSADDDEVEDDDDNSMTIQAMCLQCFDAVGWAACKKTQW